MQKTLILLLQKTICVVLNPSGKLVRCQKHFRLCRAFSVYSCAERLPLSFHELQFTRKISALSSVSQKHSLLPNYPPWLFLHQSFSNQPDMADQRFLVEYAKRGTAGCKKCKDKIQKGIVRIGKVVPNPFSESAGEMKEWYHVKCIFEKLERARATTKKIEDITDLEGWEELQDADKEIINKHVSGTKATQNVNFTFLKCFLCRKIVCEHTFIVYLNPSTAHRQYLSLGQRKILPIVGIRSSSCVHKVNSQWISAAVHFWCDLIYSWNFNSQSRKSVEVQQLTDILVVLWIHVGYWHETSGVAHIFPPSVNLLVVPVQIIRWPFSEGMATCLLSVCQVKAAIMCQKYLSVIDSPIYCIFIYS